MSYCIAGVEFLTFAIKESLHRIVPKVDKTIKFHFKLLLTYVRTRTVGQFIFTCQLNSASNFFFSCYLSVRCMATFASPQSMDFIFYLIDA